VNYVVAAVAGALALGTGGTAATPDDDLEALAEAGFTEDVEDDYGALLFAACALDIEPTWAHCYGLTDDQNAFVIQRGVISDDEYTAGATRAIPAHLVWNQGVGADGLRQDAEALLVTGDFEINAEVPGRVDHPRCETPASTEAREVFWCRFDVVLAGGTVLAAESSMSVTEDGDVRLGRWRFCESGCRGGS
jgi:hypothetical protein